jgi:Family of unknown function (DUF5670)
MLEALIVIILIFWLMGWLVFHVGDLIHLLLVIAAVVLVVRLLQGRRIV